MNTKLLPARMSLNTEKLLGLQISVLDFPFPDEVKRFCEDIGNVQNKKEWPPYRQLNNAIIACTPTLTHGFEFLYQNQDTKTRYHRALSVGTPDNPLCVPTSGQLLELIHIWVDEWVKRLRDKSSDQIDSVCDRFVAATEHPPSDWNWKSIQPQELIQDLNAKNSLAYQAIPSLLCTMLHEKVCTISGQHGEQEIRWRRVQDANGNRVGLFVISNLFRADYVDSNEKVREGYFAYRLDFRVQNQAGRFNRSKNLELWIFLHLSCQRYAHEPLSEANYGRDISVLMGMNEARLTNYNIDSTLVRLVVKNARNEEAKQWQFQLPELLSAFKARKLVSPEKILDSPFAYMRLNSSQVSQNDEYYIVHAEGYKYKPEKRARNHGIKTGFSFEERGDIVTKVLNLLECTLTPDLSISGDKSTPKGNSSPLALRDYKYVSKTKYLSPTQRENLSGMEQDQCRNAHRLQRQAVILSAYQRVLKGEKINLFLLWRERPTYNIVYQQLRDVFLLKESEDFPECISIHSIHSWFAHLF